jgi:hypothetical protein
MGIRNGTREDRMELAYGETVKASHARAIAKVVGPQVVGGRYRCGYWGQTYTVEDISLHNGWPVLRVRWEDGWVTVHGTAWNYQRDRVL